MAVLAEKEKVPVRTGFPFADWFGFDPLRGLFDDVRIEQYVEGDDFVVRAELPGVDVDKDLEITVDGGRLTLTVNRRNETKSEGRGHVRSEFRYGVFSRSVALPAGAVEADVKATYADGILTVRMPFKQPTPATKVAVTRL